VQSLAFSADGRRILTGSADATAKVWDAHTGRELLSFAGHTGSVKSVAFSRDGRSALTSSDNTAKTWNADNGRELLTLKGHKSRVWSAVFSPDGRRILSGSVDGTARLWDATTGRELLTLKGHAGPALSVTFSPDGRRILTGGWQPLARLWTTASSDEVEAWQSEDDARKQDAKFHSVLAELGKSVAKMNWDEADAYLAVAEKLIPENRQPELEQTRFKILMGRKDYLAAYELAERLSDAHLDDAELQNELAWKIVTDGAIETRGLGIAEKIATRANNAAEGQVPSILDTLARVLFMQGKSEEPIRLQEQAVALDESKAKEGLQKTLESYRKGELPKPE